LCSLIPPSRRYFDDTGRERLESDLGLDLSLQLGGQRREALLGATPLTVEQCDSALAPPTCSRGGDAVVDRRDLALVLFLQGDRSSLLQRRELVVSPSLLALVTIMQLVLCTIRQPFQTIDGPQRSILKVALGEGCQ
jgi:hypothetical protein